MAENWRDYQEEAADFFRSLGLSAETDVTLEGVRTKHDIDVVVRSRHAGFEVLWLVECKHWKSSISKLHVLALREIVSDLGADRGIILSETGFQSGAIEAANLTNVQATSLAALFEQTKSDVSAMRLRELYDRIEACREKYWELDKQYRIEVGLRPEVGLYGYSATTIIDGSMEIISRAFRGIFPIVPDSLQAHVEERLNHTYRNEADVVEKIEPLISELEEKIRVAHEGRN